MEREKKGSTALRNNIKIPLLLITTHRVMHIHAREKKRYRRIVWVPSYAAMPRAARTQIVSGRIIRFYEAFLCDFPPNVTELNWLTRFLCCTLFDASRGTIEYPPESVLNIFALTWNGILCWRSERAPHKPTFIATPEKPYVCCMWAVEVIEFSAGEIGCHFSITTFICGGGSWYARVQ